MNDIQLSNITDFGSKSNNIRSSGLSKQTANKFANSEIPKIPRDDIKIEVSPRYQDLLQSFPKDFRNSSINEGLKSGQNSPNSPRKDQKIKYDTNLKDSAIEFIAKVKKDNNNSMKSSLGSLLNTEKDKEIIKNELNPSRFVAKIPISMLQSNQRTNFNTSLEILDRKSEETKKKSNKVNVNEYNSGKDFSKPQLQSKKALVVDDNLVGQTITCEILEKFGFTWVKAPNGKEAIRIIEEQEPYENTFKLILMDTQMPILNGYATTRILKKKMFNKFISSIPIVGMIEKNDESAIKACLESGMTAYFIKPTDEEKIKEILQKFLA